MKKSTLLSIGLVLLLSTRCSKSDDPGASTAASSSATVGGQPFMATSNKVTNTGSGLIIVMSAGSQVISIVTDGNASGTYSMINASGGRVLTGTSAYGSFSNGTEAYNTKDGTLILTIDANKVSGTFSFNVKDAAGTSIAITNGKITGLPIEAVQVPAGKCLISGVVDDGSASIPLYDGDGKLLKILNADGSYLAFLWANGVVVSKVEVSAGQTSTDHWYYTSGKLHKVDQSNGNTATYSLNTAGQPTNVVFTNTSSGTVVGAFTYTYDINGNCTLSDFGGGSTETYSGYDNKPNYSGFIFRALGITFLPGDEGGYAFSTNNVGIVSSSGGSQSFYSYAYNSQGNVSTKDNGNTVVTFTYAGCN